MILNPSINDKKFNKITCNQIGHVANGSHSAFEIEYWNKYQAIASRLLSSSRNKVIFEKTVEYFRC